MQVDQHIPNFEEESQPPSDLQKSPGGVDQFAWALQGKLDLLFSSVPALQVLLV